MNSFWRDLLDMLRRRLGLPRSPERSFDLDEGLLHSLQDLADRQQRPPDEVASDLIHYAIWLRRQNEDTLHLWETLSRREQQVAALICLGYTNPQIAARLVISPETVKSHVRSTLAKFDLHKRGDLRARLSSWDFTDWDIDV
jgi:DNA-binding NarL/FixJ family response regulator